jgi:hypothetical protein
MSDIKFIIVPASGQDCRFHFNELANKLEKNYPIVAWQLFYEKDNIKIHHCRPIFAERGFESIIFNNGCIVDPALDYIYSIEEEYLKAKIESLKEEKKIDDTP